jgi:AraC family transcriptional regulator
MLTYLGKGERSYGSNPISIHSRSAWEFEAILAGRAAPLLSGHQELDPQGPRLWVFPPSTAHGWTADGRNRCEVAVFHFSQVPEPLRTLTRERGWLSCALDRHALGRIRALVNALQKEQYRPTVLAGVIHDWAVNELSVIALSEEPLPRLSERDGHAHAKTEAALAWYSENLARSPSLGDVAAAVYVSPSHLRRLFQASQRRSPLAMFSEVRIRRSYELMADSRRTLEQIGAACGFSSASAFSRSFRAQTGLSPRQWRRRHSGRAQ